MGVGVDVQFGAQLGVEVGVRVGFRVDVAKGVGVRVEVGVPMILFVKMTSVTPLPILITTFPCALSLLTVREVGLTLIPET